MPGSKAPNFQDIFISVKDSILQKVNQEREAHTLSLKPLYQEFHCTDFRKQK